MRLHHAGEEASGILVRCSGTSSTRRERRPEAGPRQELAPWKLAFGASMGQKSFQVTVAARDAIVLSAAIARARRRLGLSESCPVFSCYEAGRDGVWLHRMLIQMGVTNVVVDSSSIEVNRRARRAKTDRMDADKLLSMLLRHLAGEKKLWSVVGVPTPEQEDTRHLQRQIPGEVGKTEISSGKPQRNAASLGFREIEHPGEASAKHLTNWR
jgi:transposase